MGWGMRGMGRLGGDGIYGGRASWSRMMKAW